MAEQDHPPRNETDTDLGSPPGVPRWVKIAAIVVGVLVLLFVVLQLTGLGGDHGPGRHMSGQDPASPSATERQPAHAGLLA